MLGAAGETVLPFGDVLRRHRLAAALSQEALAERAGLSGRAIADLERGVHQFPYPDTLRRVADALGLSGEEPHAFTEAGTRTKPDETAAVARQHAVLPLPTTSQLRRSRPGACRARGGVGESAYADAVRARWRR